MAGRRCGRCGMGEAVRAVDRIDVPRQFTAEDAARLNARYADANTTELLHAVLVEGVAGRIAVVSSFGTESAVLLHLVSQIAPDAPVLFLDTGKMFPETLAYRDELVAHLGLTGLRNIQPDADTIAKRDETGLRWSYDPDGCCEIRKVIPLESALADFDASLTGRKGFQATTRADLPRFEFEKGRLKVNPLIDWTKQDLERWFEANGLPRHPLEAQGYLSIGCAPCTSVVKPGEDPRAGRWRGWNKVECGIHGESVSNLGDDPANEPVF